MGGAEVEGVLGEEEGWEGLEWVFVRAEGVIGWVRLVDDRCGRIGGVAAAAGVPTRWVLVGDQPGWVLPLLLGWLFDGC